MKYPFNTEESHGTWTLGLGPIQGPIQGLPPIQGRSRARQKTITNATQCRNLECSSSSKEVGKGAWDLGLKGLSSVLASPVTGCVTPLSFTILFSLPFV